MKVLITGREGQVVRSLLERAEGRPGVQLIAAGRPGLDLEVPGNARDAVLAVRPDVVINAAAYTAVDQAEDEHERAFRANGHAPGEIAAAARELGSRIVQISTDYVFDGRSDEPYDEGAATNPLGVYGRSKLLGEQRVREENPDHVVIRTAWVYSPFGRNFLKTMMTLAQTRDEVSVVADQRGNPTSASDIADGLLALMEAWKNGSNVGLGEVYHLAGTGAATWYEFADEIFTCSAELGLPSATARPIATADYPTRAARPANSMLNSAKFAAEVGYIAPDWRHSVRNVVQRRPVS